MNIESAQNTNPGSAAGPDPAGLHQAPHEFLSKQEVARRLKRTVRTVEIW